MPTNKQLKPNGSPETVETGDFGQRGDVSTISKAVTDRFRRAKVGADGLLMCFAPLLMCSAGLLTGFAPLLMGFTGD